MSFFDDLDSSVIIGELQSQNKFETIEEILTVLDKAGKIKDKEQALQDVYEREQYLSTGLENGLAIPHAKSDGVSSLVLGFGISRKGIDFESLDGKPANFIFLMISPKDTSGPHLKALGQITRTFKSPNIADELIKATSVDNIREILIQHNESYNPGNKA